MQSAITALVPGKASGSFSSGWVKRSPWIRRDSACVTSSDVFSYSWASPAGEVNFNYIFSGPFTGLGNSNSSKDSRWTFSPSQPQGFLVCLLSCHPQDKLLCLFVFSPAALSLTADIYWAFPMDFYCVIITTPSQLEALPGSVLGPVPFPAVLWAVLSFVFPAGDGMGVTSSALAVCSGVWAVNPTVCQSQILKRRRKALTRQCCLFSGSVLQKPLNPLGKNNRGRKRQTLRSLLGLYSHLTQREACFCRGWGKEFRIQLSAWNESRSRCSLPGVSL